MDIKVDKMADLTWQSENEVKQDQQTNKWFLSEGSLQAVPFVAVLQWRCLCGGAFEDDSNKNFADGWTGGITLRGPRGPKKDAIPGDLVRS